MVIGALAYLLLFQQPGYLNTSLSPQERAADLVSRLTLPEKVSQMQHESAAIPRLGIPAYNWWSEALHGAVGYPVTVFPQAIGLAATFDTPMMGRIGKAISDEGRARYYDAIAHGRHGMHEGLTFWAPNVNIFRDPRWGRGQETYGEDPYLTSRMAVAYVSAMQAENNGHLKAIATPKHYAVHSGPDPERHRFNAVVDPLDMWNTYLPAFRAAVTEAHAWSVMSAYSAVDDIPCSANPMLLQTILRDKWGFAGYVVSDCGAINDIYGGHKFVATDAEASAAAVNAGTDLECGGAYSSLVRAVQAGLIKETTVNKSVTRLMEARVRLGMFDPPSNDPFRTLTMKVVDSAPHRALALEAAQKSIVLLKNDGILPLRKRGTVAVVGPNANDTTVPLGNYNGTPSRTVSVLDGLRKSGLKVLYAQGSARTEGLDVVPIPASAFTGGVQGAFYLGTALKGDSIWTTHTDDLSFDWGMGKPTAAMPADGFSARFTTTLVAPKTGEYSLGTRADDGVRLKLDGKVIVEDWSEHAAQLHTKRVNLVAGQSYKIELEYYESAGYASAQLVWSVPGAMAFDAPIAAARKSDVVVMVLGISGEIENEELDRADIQLPAIQTKLLNAILATGKPVVVVLESGSCIPIADKRVKALVQAWYPGEEGGTAVADVLLGKVSPSGRLPITIYKSLAQVPPIRSYKMDGRTYRYLHQAPLYPFGYGLSYSKFAYKDLKANGKSADVTVQNVGNRAADEVVQVYAARDGAKWPEPLRKLVAFTRVHLKAGESKRVHLPINQVALGMFNAKGDVKIVPGKYTLSVGGGQPGSEPATSGRDMSVRILGVR